MTQRAAAKRTRKIFSPRSLRRLFLIRFYGLRGFGKFNSRA